MKNMPVLYRLESIKINTNININININTSINININININMNMNINRNRNMNMNINRNINMNRNVNILKGGFPKLNLLGEKKFHIFPRCFGVVHWSLNPGWFIGILTVAF